MISPADCAHKEKSNGPRRKPCSQPNVNVLCPKAMAVSTVADTISRCHNRTKGPRRSRRLVIRYHRHN